MTMVLLLATEDDLHLLAQMNYRLIEDEESRNRMSIRELKQRLAGWFQGGWQIVRFEEDGINVGYTVYQVMPDEYDPHIQVIHVRQMFIDRPYRNRGLGTQAFKILVDDWFPMNSRMVLEVMHANENGQSFWTKLGFTPYCTTMTMHNSFPQ